jgi:hypothetical protein
MAVIEGLSGYKGGRPYLKWPELRVRRVDPEVYKALYTMRDEVLQGRRLKGRVGYADVLRVLLVETGRLPNGTD